MPETDEIRGQTLIALSPVLLPGGLAVCAIAAGEAAWALAFMVCGGVCLGVNRWLLNQNRRAREEKCLLDRQLIQSQKLAAIGQLSSGIAHEINNPLAIIGQEVEWVCHLLGNDAFRGIEGIDDVNDSLREIVRQVERCGEITHKLLDFARKREPLIQPADVNRLIEDMVRLVELEARGKRIRLGRQYAPDLPPVRTDPPLLRQVILNLINNAVQAVEENGGSIMIGTSPAGPNGVRITVSDTGCGIPSEFLDKIFDPFFTTKSPGKGTGLGLSLCHGILTRLGAHIDVASTVGQGTTFTIIHPVDGGTSS